MAGEKLHEYDLALCDYIVGNVRQHLDEESFTRGIKRQLSRSALLPYLLKTPVHAEPERTDGVEDEPAIPLQDEFLLNEDEIQTLAFAIEEPDDATRKWAPYKALHRRYTATLKEVKNELGAAK
jgi:hypothetical protein